MSDNESGQYVSLTTALEEGYAHSGDMMADYFFGLRPKDHKGSPKAILALGGVTVQKGPDEP